MMGENAQAMRTGNKTPILVPPGTGKPLDFPGETVRVRISGEQTGGAYSIIETVVLPNSGAPLHRHDNEDEIFYIVEGEFDLTYGDKTHRVKPGTVAVLPKGEAHTYRNVGEEPGKILITIVPAGFEHFFEEVTDTGDAEEMRSAAERYRVEFPERPEPKPGS
jgi:quercetin dioxygenase-like cupin family protein